MDFVKLAAALLELLKPNEAGQMRKNLRLFRKGRKKVYRDFKKGGFTKEETEILAKLDNAYVEMLLSLNKF